MNLDEWHEQAGRAAYAAFNKTRVYKTVAFDDLNELDQDAWREVARAVLGEGKIEFRRSPKLAEQETREENARLVKIAREWSETAANYREAADELKSKLDGLQRAYDHACAQRDKYMRRTAEWRDVAQNDTFRQDTAWLVSEVGREHIRRCEVEQCDTCSTVLGIEEKLQLLEDDGVRACTGCANGCEACAGVFRPGGIPVPDND